MRTVSAFLIGLTLGVATATGGEIEFVRYVGGGGAEQLFAVASDPAGNGYASGRTRSLDFPTTPGVVQPAAADEEWTRSLADGFVVKLAPDGSTVYATYLGGASFEYGWGIAADAEGYAYTTGMTGQLSSSVLAFPVTDNAYQKEKGTYESIYVTKLSPDGSSMPYSTLIAGNDNDNGYSIAVDGMGRAFVAGKTHSTDYPVTGNGFQTGQRSPTVPGAGLIPDAVVSGIDTTKSGRDSLVFSSYLGGLLEEALYGVYEVQNAIAVDEGGFLYVAGRTSSVTDFPTTPGSYRPSRIGGVHDVFVAKIDPHASDRSGSLVWSTFLGGTGDEEADAVAVGPDGTVYVAGWTDSSDFPATAGAARSVPAGADDAFVAALAADGSTLVAATYIGGSDRDRAFGIAVRGGGSDGRATRVLVTGSTESDDFPVAGAFQPVRAGGVDAFFVALDPELETIELASYFGGSGDDSGEGVAVSGADGAWIGGNTSSDDLPSAAEPAPGGENGFLARILLETP